MNDYAPLLFSYKTELFEKKVSFSQDYAAISKYGFSEQEYEHDSFPFYVNDDQHVLAHAAKICESLTSLDNDSGKELKLKKELVRDYKNYISCFSFAGTGERELAAAFTEIMFAYNLDTVVAAEIKDYCQSDDDSDFCLSENQILNFDKLYLKAGDRALFINHDLSLALELYKLAIIEWPSSESQIDSFSVDESIHLEKLINILVDLSTGRLISNKMDFDELLHPDYYQVYEAYKSVVLSFIDVWKNDGFVNTLELFFLIAQKSINNQKEIDETFRIIMVMVNYIYKLTFVPFLYHISLIEEKSNWTEHIDLICSKIPYLKDSDFENLFHYYITTSSSDGDVRIFDFIRTVGLVNNSLELLRINEHLTDFAYYTSLETFSYMLPSGNKEQLGKLAVMNISYMNDPNEGKIFDSFLFGKNVKRKMNDGRRSVKVPYVFVKCFTSQIDYLPMWEMYGNHAEGCCLVIDWNTTTQTKSKMWKALFRVCYLHKKGNSFTIRKEENPQISDTKLIYNYLKELKGIASHIESDDTEFFNTLLGELPYLFKESSYSYEEEIRFLYIYKKIEKEFKHTDQSVPKLFIIPEFPICIKEVILGPKVINIAEKIPYLQEQIELMCEKTGMENPKITVSDIEFR